MRRIETDEYTPDKEVRDYIHYLQQNAAEGRAAGDGTGDRDVRKGKRAGRPFDAVIMDLVPGVWEEEAIGRLKEIDPAIGR